MWPVIRHSIALRPAPHRQYVPIPEPARPRLVPKGGPGLYPDEPETCRRDLRQFLPILVHLGLLFAVFKVYRVEGRAFQILVALALAASAGPLPAPLPLEEAVVRGGLGRRAGLGLRRRDVGLRPDGLGGS